MCTFDDSFPVLAATVTKPNIRRKTNPDNPNVFYRKAFLANKGCGTPFSSTRFPKPRNLFLETAKLPPKIYGSTQTVVSNSSISLVQRK